MNYVKGDIIIIGATEQKGSGVMFHRSGITFAEAKRYDPTLTADQFDELLEIIKVEKKEKVKLSDKSEKKVYKKKYY